MNDIRKIILTFFRVTIATLTVGSIGMSILHPNDIRTIEYWIALAATIIIYFLLIKDKTIN